MYLGNLGLSQLRHYERFGILADIKDSISNFQKAVVLTLDGHIDKPLYLGNLGIGQLRLYECLGELTDVEDSISNLQKATQFTETGHTDKPMFLSNLGTSHMMRYHRLGELTDLEDCIFNLQKVVGLTDEGHPDKPIRLSNFGLSQLKRFERLGDLADIEDCISNLQKAVQHTEDGHPNMPAYLGNLGISQGKLYDRLGEQIDLEDSISNLGKAVQFTMDGHRDKPIYLGNLGTSQLRLYWRFAELTSLEDSILNLQKSVLLTEDGHPDKPIYISNLGVCQRIRFEHLGKLTDLQNSISNLHEAVRLTEDEHPNKPRYFGNLGLSQLKRYECNSEQTDIEEAIWHFKKAVQLTDEDHPRRANCLSELGTAQRLRFECLGRPADLIDSISAFREAAKSKTAYPRDTLSAARQWAEASHRNGDLPSALDGYRLALEILPKVAWLGLSTASRQNWLIQEGSENLTCLSATCAIQLGRLEEAVELLDLGRSVFWQQASSLRSDLEELRKMEPELADCLGKVGQKLDAGNFSSSLLSDREQHIGAHDAQDVGKERRRLVAEWQGLLDRVRQLPQFEHFLKPVPFRQLRQAANGGQVVLINASEYGVDALIFDAADQIEHVPLPKATVGALSKLAGDILLHRPITAFEAQRHSYNGRYLKPALRTVWNDILIPIFQRIHLPLHGNSDAPKRRIWWYPTGPLTFIPIHAAGPGKNENDASHLVISSYVTTLGSLFQAQKKWRQCDFKRPKFLAVSQQDTPGQESLPLAMEEVDKVLQIVNSAGWPKEDTVRLSGSDATVDRVSGALDSTSWIHLACHGIQHPISGMKSALALHNGDLELNHIASKRLSSGQFAFLSACHTAAGLQRLPREAMHIAGGLQFSGFPSVIATMWGVSDKDAPVVACHTYEYLFRNGVEGCDPSEAATALIFAVLRLREDPNVTVDRWAPFIHFGI
jgi:tetratricopeptide (TPR) repeat protein